MDKNIFEKLKNKVNENMKYWGDVEKEELKLLANLSKSDFLCFDTESCRDYKNNNNERVWCWSLSNTVNDMVIYGYTIDHFITFINNLYLFKQFTFTKTTKSKNFNLKLWVHNLGWDIEFFKYWLVDNEYTYVSKIMFDDDTIQDEKLDCNTWNITENNGQVYNSTITIKKNDIVFGKKHIKSYINLKFYDSVKLIPDKLDTIARKIIDIDEIYYKLGDDFDYDYIRPYNHILTLIEKCYIYNDVYILKEFIRQYYIKNGLVGYTASSIAFNNMLNFTYPNAKDKYEEFTLNYPEILDKKVIKLIDESYGGGLTECNPTHKGNMVIGEGHSIDINSSYPSQMKYKPLPFGMPKYYTGKYKKDKKYNIAIQKIHFDGFRRKNGSPIGFIKIGNCENFNKDIKKIGYKLNDYADTNFDENGNLLTYNYNLVLTIEELKLLESAYDFYVYRRIGDTILKGKKNLIKGIDYIEGVKFLSKIGDFKNFIDDCVVRKNKYKDEKNECGKTVAKRDMNSVSGKFGSGYTRKIMNYVQDDNKLFKFQRKYINDKEYDYLEKRKYYRAYISFVTSYGRQQLISTILKIENMYGQDKFLYCDTDSIYSLLSVKQLESLKIDLDGKKLGAWDIEKEFTKFKCLGAKKYILYGHEYGSSDKDKIHQHCSGLPENIQKELNFENFYLGNTFTKKQKKKVVGGYRLEWTTYKLKEFTFYN